MALNETLLLSALTIAQCAALRDELVALVGDVRVRRIKRAALAGTDLLNLRAINRQEKEAVDAFDAAIQAQRNQLEPTLATLRQQRQAIENAHYGPE